LLRGIDPALNATGCTSMSSYYLSTLTASTALGTLNADADLKGNTEKSSIMDYYMKPLYDFDPQNNGIVSAYVGIPMGTPVLNNPNSIFRQFPGQYRSRSYNPTARGWYNTAYRNAGQIAITEPYKSSSLRIFEVTFVQAFYRNCSTVSLGGAVRQPPCPGQDFLGVVGFDVFISNLEVLFSSLSYTKESHAILYSATTGVVVVSKDWDHTQRNSTTVTVDELMGPGFMLNYGMPSLNNVLEYHDQRGRQWLLVTTEVNLRDDSNMLGNDMMYWVTLLVPEDEALTDLSRLMANIDGTREEAFYVISFVGCGITVCLMIFAMFMATRIAAPVISLGGPKGLADQAIKNAQTTRVAQGMDSNAKRWTKSQDEIGLLYKEFNVMSEKIDRTGQVIEVNESLQSGLGEPHPNAVDSGHVGT